MGAMEMLTEQDIYLFREGTHSKLHRSLGCHLLPESEGGGASFAVWAPNAREISVIGDWNGWKRGVHLMKPRWDSSGIWELHVPGVQRGQAYKYAIRTAHGHVEDRADPFAFHNEVPPATASRAWSLEYGWGDRQWMQERRNHNAMTAPMSVYEVHLGSWRRSSSDRLPTYREIAVALAEYVSWLGFTHVELMPITEHPFYGSWGYQTTGYFAPSARYGSPQDFMYLVDTLHQHGIGVILDWVPSHFPSDAHGLANFDGTHLYEHADPRRGFHPEWKSYIFNYGRHEVRAFLISSALFWLENYHIDGIRVDAVASMLYLDYGRKHGEWIPNVHGGKEDLEAIEFLKQLNIAVGRDFPDTRTIAEESTSWPQVSRPVFSGGLGFSMKWNMGWMHDTLDYMAHDPIHRRYHQGELTFSLWYAFSENFVLPLSHDEVVHGKRSLLSKMPGDRWQQLANLRALYAYMWAHPGKKLLFMGGELAQEREWRHDESLDWHLLEQPGHSGVQALVRDLNRLYREEPALYEVDFEPAGFMWLEPNDADANVLAFARLPARKGRPVVCVCNLSPVPREGYRLGLPRPGRWRELLNTDSTFYGGSDVGNLGGIEASGPAWHDQPQSAELRVPPLAVVWLVPE